EDGEDDHHRRGEQPAGDALADLRALVPRRPGGRRGTDGLHGVVRQPWSSSISSRRSWSCAARSSGDTEPSARASSSELKSARTSAQPWTVTTPRAESMSLANAARSGCSLVYHSARLARGGMTPKAVENACCSSG